MSFNESEPGFLRVTVDSTTLTFEYYTVPFGGAAVSRFDSIQVPIASAQALHEIIRSRCFKSFAVMRACQVLSANS